MAGPKSVLNIQSEVAGWRRIPRLRSRLEKAMEATFAHLSRRMLFPCEINLLLTGNAAMRRLNRDFRGVDKPTNVLSFPQFDPEDLPQKKVVREPIQLGDLVMSYQYIVVEAKKDHKILINHVSHLMIHGILHLFGYDHSFDREAVKMEGLETRIMASLGLPDPYAPRADFQVKAVPRKK